MKIEINQENFKQLVQCIYLGNLIINEYRNDMEIKREYSDFMEEVLMKIIKTMPQAQPKFKFRYMPNEKSDNTLLADFIDKIEDSISEFYEEYRLSLFSESLTDLITDKKHHILDNSEIKTLDHLFVKNF